MSGTSIDAVDAALILTDGERVLDFGPVAERKYTPEERATLKAAVDAARKWAWTGPQPAAAFREANAVLTKTHSDAWQQLINGWNGPVPAIAGVHGQTVLHKPPANGARGNTLQILDADSLRSELGVPLAYDFRSADVEAGRATRASLSCCFAAEPRRYKVKRGAEPWGRRERHLPFR